MKIYLAARYDRREEIARHAAYARENGITVTSVWLEPPVVDNPNSSEPQDWWGLEAQRDLRDIKASDAIVMFTEPAGALYPRGGRHVEFGLAMGLGKVLIIIGEPENIFQSLPLIECYETFEKFVDDYKPARLVRHSAHKVTNSFPVSDEAWKSIRQIYGWHDEGDENDSKFT